MGMWILRIRCQSIVRWSKICKTCLNGGAEDYDSVMQRKSTSFWLPALNIRSVKIGVPNEKSTFAFSGKVILRNTDVLKLPGAIVNVFTESGGHGLLQKKSSLLLCSIQLLWFRVMVFIFMGVIFFCIKLSLLHKYNLLRYNKAEIWLCWFTVQIWYCINQAAIFSRITYWFDAFF